MANEVIIEEYATTGLTQSGRQDVPVPCAFVTSQNFSIASASANFGAGTAFIRIQSKGTGFWYALDASVVANAAGARWLPADQFRDLAIKPGVDVKIATAA